MEKKLITLLAIIIFVIAFAELSFFSINFTGTTTNDYVVSDSLVTTAIPEYTIAIANADTANTLSYKVSYYFGSWSGVSYDAYTDTLQYGTVYYSIDDIMYGVKVSIKSTVDDSSTTYKGYFDFKK